MQGVVGSVSQQYASMVSELLDMLHKTEQSLARVRRNKTADASAAGDGNAELSNIQKISLQLFLDVQVSLTPRCILLKVNVNKSLLVLPDCLACHVDAMCSAWCFAWRQPTAPFVWYRGCSCRLAVRLLAWRAVQSAAETCDSAAALMMSSTKLKGSVCRSLEIRSKNLACSLRLWRNTSCCGALWRQRTSRMTCPVAELVCCTCTQGTATCLQSYSAITVKPDLQMPHIWCQLTLLMLTQLCVLATVHSEYIVPHHVVLFTSSAAEWRISMCCMCAH